MGKRPIVSTTKVTDELNKAISKAYDKGYDDGVKIGRSEARKLTEEWLEEHDCEVIKNYLERSVRC